MIFGKRKLENAINRRTAATKSLQAAVDKFLSEVRRWQVGKGLVKEWDDEKAIKDGLKSNVWVYACCEKIAPDVASVPLVVETEQDGEWKKDPNHPLNEVLANPSPRKTLSSIMRTGELTLLLGGNAIIYHPIVGNLPKGMQTMKPWEITVKPDGQGGVLTYTRNIDGYDKPIKDAPESILHVMYEDPANSYWGLGKMQAAGYVVNASTKAIEWNNELLDNATASDLAFIFKSYLQSEQYAEEVDKLRDMYAGAKNAGKPIVLDDGATVQNFGRTPKEMDFVKSQEAAMYAICAAFGVDPRLIGAKEFSGRAAREEAERGYWMHTVIPEVQLWAETMTLYYRNFWPEVRVSYDTTNVEALQEETKSKAETGRILFDMGVTLKEINRRLEIGLELDDVPGADSPYGIETRSADNKRTMVWKRKDGERRVWENRIAEEYKKGLKSDIRKLASHIEDGKQVRDLKDELTEAWNKRLEVSYEALARFFGKEKWNELIGQKSVSPSQTKDFNAGAARMAAMIRDVARKRALVISDYTVERVANVAADAIAEGESLSEVTRRVREQGETWTEPIQRSRAMRIARTETGAGINLAREEARMQLEDEHGWTVKKQWLSARDGRVRDGSDSGADHAALDGETVGTNDFFSNGLMYPGDPGGPAEEIINCRCDTIDVVED